MRRRRIAPGGVVVPAVLPQVVVTVTDDGSVRAAVDGIEQAGGPLTRSDLGHVLGSIAEQAGGPIRVEVHDADGTCYADILQPPPAAEAASATAPVTGRDATEAPVLSAEGFLPGETVAVAVVETTVTADRHGTIHVTLSIENDGGGSDGDVILFGTVSATTIRSGIPGHADGRPR